MTEGFVLDRGDTGYKMPSVWIEGEPEESFWSNGLKTSHKNIFRIRALRCSKCKFLEFYTAEIVDI